MTGPLVRFPRIATDGFSKRAESWVAVLPDAVAMVTPYEFQVREGENVTRIELRSGGYTTTTMPADEVLAALWPEAT